MLRSELYALNTCRPAAGPVIAQATVPVHPSDTPEMLAERILAVEHKLYPEALKSLASGKVKLENGLALFS
jgi:phosphoribosylglycinamide formyltransferase-1